MPQLTILFVIDSLGTGGAEREMAEKLPLLRDQGVAAIVVGLRHRDQGVQTDLERQGFDVRILRGKGLLSRVAAVRTIIRSERPDLIETVLFHSDLTGRLAAIGTSTKIISRLVNTDYDRARLHDPTLKITKFRLSRFIERLMARHLTDQLYANSDAVKVAATRDLRLPSDKITVIVERRDPVRLGRPSLERRKQSRRRLGLKEDQEVLINVGRQDYQKGQRFLLEAVERLADHHPRLVLLVAGRRGGVSGDLERLRGQLGLEDRVRFLGHREDVPDLLAAADLFAFPSFYEGLPGAVTEALALGLPIVASDIEPVREMVEPGRNAILVPPASPVELASAIEQILEDHLMAQAFGRRSREIFEELFACDDRYTAQLMDLYRRVVSEDQ